MGAGIFLSISELCQFEILLGPLEPFSSNKTELRMPVGSEA